MPSSDGQADPSSAQLFVRGCEVPARHHRTSPIGRAGYDTLADAFMAAEPEHDGMLGLGVVAVFPGNASRKMPALTSIYLLFESSAGAQLATVAGDVLAAPDRATSTLAISYANYAYE
jgi:ornithine cyclodeaminase/alanine dehydrogenase-like protein (mu-crystallin family)